MITEQQPDNLGFDPVAKAPNPNNRPNADPEGSAEALLEAFYEEFVVGRHYGECRAAGE